MSPPRRSAVRFALTFLAVAAWFALAGLPTPARIWVVLLLVPLPFAAVAQMRLTGNPETLPRMPVYASTSIFLWLLALASLLVGRFSQTSVADAGLNGVPPVTFALQSVSIVAFGIASLFVSRWLGITESPVVRRLIPTTGPERLAFAGVSMTAGFCEELVFRGYLLHWLTTAWGPALAVIASCAVFGWMHAYQNGRGALRAAFLGLILCVPPLTTGSIAAGIAAHAGIDLIAGLFLAHRLLPDLA
jgi:CAAX protease family protein